MADIYHSRSVLIAAGVALLAVVAWSFLQQRKGQTPFLNASRLQRLESWTERHYAGLWMTLGLGFFLTTYVAKISQLHSLALNGWDFWLFEDMLRQMGKGGFFLTRFAPQAVGWVQHGAVHPMFSWILALPLSWIVGPTHAALMFGPLVFAGAGLALASVARPHWGALGALSLATAFWASNQVGRVLMYDVHPESAYPLFVLLWAWAAGMGDRKLRAAPLLLSTIALMATKEDSFLILLPLIGVVALSAENRADRRKQIGFTLAALAALSVTALQFYAVQKWTSGAWGPHEWNGASVTLPLGADLMKSHHWDHLGSAFRIGIEIAEEKGGPIGVLLEFIRFLFSRPLLSLLLVAPWIVRRPRFWISAAPLLLVYSLLEAPSKFINYYSAPFLGLFWLAAAATPLPASRKHAAIIWVLSASLLLGGAGIDFYRPTPLAKQARDEARARITCLKGQGVVTSPFLGEVPHERVWTERDPQGLAQEADFYLFSTQIASYEMPPDAARKTFLRLKQDPRWVSLESDCRPGIPNENAIVFLFAKR